MTCASLGEHIQKKFERTRKNCLNSRLRLLVGITLLTDFPILPLPFLQFKSKGRKCSVP